MIYNHVKDCEKKNYRKGNDEDELAQGLPDKHDTHKDPYKSNEVDSGQHFFCEEFFLFHLILPLIHFEIFNT